MGHKIGGKITYDTPLSGGGIYKAEILEIENETAIYNAYKVKVLKVIRPSQNPIAPQKVGDIDHIIQEKKAEQWTLKDS